MSSRKLLGSNRDIRGGYHCVCFSEAPIELLSRILALPPTSGIRYRPFGVMVAKTWLFQQGGRPVIYQPDSEFEALPEPLRYRHVRYEPNGGADYSWEREWRVRSDELAIDPNRSTLIVPHVRGRSDCKINGIQMTLGGKALLGIRTVLPLDSFPWHFIGARRPWSAIPQTRINRALLRTTAVKRIHFPFSKHARPAHYRDLRSQQRLY